jgi:hypothetical protein
MRKIYTVGLAVVAVFAFSVIAAASASAATEWLLEGAAIPSPGDTVETTGELLLEDTGTGTQIECSGKFDGTVGPGATDKIEKILNLAGVEETSNENLAKVTKPAIDCKVEAAGLCNVTVGALIWVFPLHLPWKTELLLPEATLWVDDIVSGTGGEPGYEVSCSTIIGVQTDVCEGKPGSIETNVTGGVEGVFEEAETFNPRGTCSIGGAKTALTVGKGITAPTTGGTLTVS